MIRKILTLIFILVSIWTSAQYTGQDVVFVGVVNASDPDSGQKLTYRITYGNAENFFSITPGTGTLIVNRAVYTTFKDQRTWKLSVSVTDNNAEKPMSSAATITVILKKDELNGAIKPVMMIL